MQIFTGHYDRSYVIYMYIHPSALFSAISGAKRGLIPTCAKLGAKSTS